MAIKWISDGKGIRYYEHQTRKYGKRPDRYYTLVYRLGGKIKTESLGWESGNCVLGGESLLKRAQCLCWYNNHTCPLEKNYVSFR